MAFKYKGKEYTSFKIGVDSATVNMFDFQLISGSRDFMLQNNNKLAITDRFAKQLFGAEDPIGKEIDIYGDKVICAVVKPWDTHSNLPFDFLNQTVSEKNGMPLPGKHLSDCGKVPIFRHSEKTR